MNFLAVARIAVNALKINALRSSLAMLGIIIGVGAFIASGAIGTGAQQRIADEIRSLGSNLIIILSGSTTAGGLRMGHGSMLTLTEDDAWAIQREVPGVQAAAPSMRGTAQVVAGNLNWSTIIYGATLEYFEVREWSLVSGKPFTQEDVDGATKVAILGQTVVQNLLGDADPLDQIIRIRKVPFTVIGVLDRKGQNAWGQDQDDTILIPLSTAKKRVLGVSQANARSVGAISVKVREAENVAEAEQQIRDILRQRHRLQPFQDDDFSIRNMTEVLQAQEESMGVLTNLLYAIAGVSLMVGGIGIMNIMLVSVTERTREIGLRMAVGARGRDILSQFLIEAVVLSLIGGVVGVLTGVSGSQLIAHLAKWSPIIQAQAIPIALGFASAVGIFFGFYPAWKASRLDPIDALRYE